MAGIFLSYRRSDAEGQAGRLYDELAGHFGQDTVFMDVAGIEAGRDFRQAIDQHVTACGVLLAIIGKEWVSAMDSNGRRRLDDPNDFVRLEVATALKRDIPVVPVLVRGAVMPQATELPADCADLCYRNAVELTHARWNSDVQVLIKALSRYVEVKPAPAPEADSRSALAGGTPSPAGITGQQSHGARPWLIALPIVLAIVGGGVVAYRFNDDSGTKPAAQDNQKPQTVLAADAADNPAQRKAAEAGSAAESGKPQVAGGNQRSEWMLAAEFQAYRQARPPAESFPYDIELQCVKKGENRIRARFGPQPRSVQEVRIGHFLFRGEAKLPVVDGYREFSIARCNMPGGAQMIVRVMVRP